MHHRLVFHQKELEYYPKLEYRETLSEVYWLHADPVTIAHWVKDPVKGHLVSPQ